MGRKSNDTLAAEAAAKEAEAEEAKAKAAKEAEEAEVAAKEAKEAEEAAAVAKAEARAKAAEERAAAKKAMELESPWRVVDALSDREITVEVCNIAQGYQKPKAVLIRTRVDGKLHSDIKLMQGLEVKLIQGKWTLI